MLTADAGDGIAQRHHVPQRFAAAASDAARGVLPNMDLDQALTQALRPRLRLGSVTLGGRGRHLGVELLAVARVLLAVLAVRGLRTGLGRLGLQLHSHEEQEHGLPVAVDVEVRPAGRR